MSQPSIVSIGVLCKLYLGAGARAAWPGSANSSGIYVGAAPASLTEFSVARDVSIAQAYGKGDGSSRLQTVKLMVSTLEELAVDVTFSYQAQDVGLQLARAAYATRGTLSVLVLDGSILNGSSSGSLIPSVGRWFDGIVTDFPLEEPIDKQVDVKMKIEPTPSGVPAQWVQVA